MTEWQLQQELTEAWLREGLSLDGRKWFLVAWEVMAPTWRINGARVEWNMPSVDFIAADEGGRIALIELKSEAGLTTRTKTWCAAFQVSFMAAALRRADPLDGLETAHAACRSSIHGRSGGGPVPDLPVAHRDFFQLGATPSMGRGSWRCVLAAPSFAPVVRGVVDEWNQLPWQARLGTARDIAARLKRTPPAIKRFLTMDVESFEGIEDRLDLLEV